MWKSELTRRLRNQTFFIDAVAWFEHEFPWLGALDEGFILVLYENDDGWRLLSFVTEGVDDAPSCCEDLVSRGLDAVGVWNASLGIYRKLALDVDDKKSAS